MHYLNEEIDLREEFPFFFVIDKDLLIKDFVFDLVEFYFRKINFNFSSNLYKKYSYFLKRISDTKRFNLDQESLFIELEEEILNG